MPANSSYPGGDRMGNMGGNDRPDYDKELQMFRKRSPVDLNRLGFVRAALLRELKRNPILEGGEIRTVGAVEGVYGESVEMTALTPEQRKAPQLEAQAVSKPGQRER